MSHERILIVDDNPLNLKLLRLVLAADAGCNGYLTKPIDTRSLAGTVAAFFSNAPENNTV